MPNEDYMEALQYFLDSPMHDGLREVITKCRLAGISEALVIRAYIQFFTNSMTALLPKGYLMTDKVRPELTELYLRHLDTSLKVKREKYVQAKNRPRT